MRRWILAALACAAGLTPALAQDLDRPLPVDPDVRIGKLDNGFTYYLRRNERPEHRVELRLAVNAGSVLEEDDQQGLAHFLEHMAFNGTENFAAGELVDYLESVGARFGPDLNAYTSFDETVYMLQIPTDKEGLLDRGILILRDWASRILNQPGEVDKERGVVLDEWRQGLGVQERLRQKHWPVLFGGRYADRLPIGKPEVLETAPPGRLEAFYRDWYRPDLMAFVAVGDIDVDAMETQVRATFGDLAGPEAPRERTVYDIPYHAEPRVSVATDPEQPYTQVWIAFKHDKGARHTVRAYRTSYRNLLFTSMLNQRLGEIARNPDPPFLFAATSPGGFARSQDMFSAFAVTPEDGAEAGARALMTEIARVRAHGFGEAELERARAEILAYLERAYNERDKSESAGYAGEYLRHFLEGEDIPGIEVEYALAGELLPGITLDDLEQAAAELVHEDNMAVMASVPEKEGLTPPDPGAYLAAALEAYASAPAPYDDGAAGTALLAELPPESAVRERRELPELGVTVAVLANGVEVWIKPTDFKNDEIVFGAQCAGGTSLAAEADYPSADAATAVVGEGGYGGHTPTDLEKILAGKIVSVSPFIGLFTQGIRGRTTPRDLETALQAAYLQFTQPNRRPESFTVLTDRFRTFVLNRDSDPDTRYRDRTQELLRDGHYTALPWDMERIDAIDLDRALEFYRARFADASDYRFYFVGAVDVDAALPLIARYLGALPVADDGPPDYRDVGLRFRDDAVREVVRAGTEPKAHTTIAWPARVSLDEMDMYELRLAADVLEIRLRDRLREELGASYSVGVGYSYLLPYPGYATVSVTFGSSPGDVDGMIEVVFEEAAKFEAEGPTPEELDKVKELDRRAVETGLRENGYWLSSFQTLDILGWESDRVLHRLDRIDEVTLESVHEAVRGAFPAGRRVVVSLEPEASGEP